MSTDSIMIQSHLYANKPETPLFAERGINERIDVLASGNWVGVLAELDGWYNVLTILGEGWVKKEDVEARAPFNLHVHWEPGKPIQYVCAA